MKHFRRAAAAVAAAVLSFGIVSISAPAHAGGDTGWDYLAGKGAAQQGGDTGWDY